MHCPPYHSKYNPIERVGHLGRTLEWDVTDDPESGDALGLDHDMEWGVSEVLQIDKTYEKGVTISDKEWAQLQGTHLERSPTLPK